MSYDDLAQEQQGQVSIELYSIANNTSTSLFAASKSDVVYKGATYQAAPIKRGELSTTSDGQTSVTVSAPPTDELTAYVSSYPALPTKMKIYRLFESDLTSALLLFSGRVTSVSLSGNVAAATCKSGTSMLNAKIPTVLFSSFCQHSLFDSGCGLSAGDYKVKCIVTQSGVLLTETSGTVAAKADGWFTGGYINIGSEYRMITLHSGNSLYLQLPFPASTIAENAFGYAFPSCDKSASMCKNKFNNLTPGAGKGFMGMPMIPSKNPVIWGIK